jgi:hypothetical protein
MNTIHESLTVLCPFDQIARAIATFTATLPSEDGKAVIAIRVTVGDLIVERRADLVLRNARSYVGAHIMDVELRPHDGGLYPTFRGTLGVEEGVGNFCRLDLDGGYVPPLGLAGAMFDAVAGRHIAIAATRELLDTIRIGIEFAFQTGATIGA